MNPVQAIGLVALLAALAWCAWSIVRLVIGPSRAKAARNIGVSVVAFVLTAAVVGSTMRPVAGPSVTIEQPIPASVVTSTTVVGEIPPSDVPIPMPRPVSRASISIVARYETTPTMKTLVIANLTPSNEAQLAILAAAECGSERFCSVGFWSDADLAPRKLKMTDLQVAGRIAQYAHSTKTGLNRLLWNCSARPHQSSECLP